MRRDTHPVAVFVILLVVVFAAEALVMLAFAALRMSPRPVSPVADALLLTLIVAPFLWLLVVAPLRRAAADARGILRTTMDGFWVVDAQGRFLDVNAAYCRMVGYTRDELLAMRIPDVEAAESPQETAAHIAGVMRAGADRFTTRHRRKDGAVLDVEVSANYLPLNGGRFFVFVRDVTERRRAEGALRQLTDDLEQRVAVRTADLEAANRTLRESERGLRESQEVGRVGSYVFDIQADGWRSSAILDAIFGIGAAFPRTAAGWGALVHPSERDDMLRYLGEIIAGHRRFDREYRIVRANDGAERWVLGLGEVEYGRDGVPLRMVGAIQDVTERKRAEAALRLQSAALNAAADAMVITDRDGTIVWVNQAFTAISGYPAEEAVGRNPRDLVKSGVHDQAFYRQLWDTLLAGDVWHGEMTNRRKDGSLYTEDQTITPVRDAAGEITHFIAIKRDVTEKKQMEAQFLQSQKMDTVGQLAGGIAHDFNNLLTVINATADMALMDLPEGERLRLEFQHIRQAGLQAAALTRQLLAFSRKQIMMPRVLDLSALVAGERDMLQRLIGEDIDLVVLPAKEVGRVRVDPAQIEQVIMNLAVNARDAMPDGGTLTIETRDVELDEAHAATHPSVTSGPHVLLAVSDTGVGMDEATRLRIFEPFFTTKEAGRGTGLGLSTVYGIVKQSGGSIWVYSEPGHGTTFKVYLPRVDGSAQLAWPDRTAVAVPGTETILVVEDQEALRSVVERILRRSGYTVLTAGNGADAQRVLERHDGLVQLVLTDVVMPGLNGPALAARIAEIWPGIKVLYTSGYTDDVILRHGLIDSALHFISKPYDIAALTRKVREVLDAS